MTPGLVETRTELMVTAAGFAQLTAALESLRTEARRSLSERLREARDDGDLDDNPALVDALEEQAHLERRITLLEAQLAVARVAEPSTTGVAGVGNTVRVRDDATGEVAVYELVGVIEADVGAARVSVDAPVGRALVGRRAGDRVEVATPRGPRILEVLEVGWTSLP